MYAFCDVCGVRMTIGPAPLQLCSGCGVVFRPRQKKYVIDFTVAKHGQYDIRAKTEEQARKMFNEFIKENEKEASIFMEHFTFNCDIKINYAYAADDS